MNTLIIAEAGSNHNQNIEQAFKLIEIAAQAKCDVVKFQIFSASELLGRCPNSLKHIVESCELPRDWIPELIGCCIENSIEFLATPFDEYAVHQLVDLGVKRIKVAGFEATDLRFIDMVTETKLPLIISLGIGSDTDYAITLYQRIMQRNSHADITFLHCNNSYPTPYQDINLLTIKKLLSKVPVVVGLSDHTPGILVPPVAVALGAEVIEKHFTISRLLPGPDHSFAIEPQELTEMVKNIRTVESTLSFKTDSISNSEFENRRGMRSVYASIDIHPGDILTFNNTTTKRPHNTSAIPAREYYDIMGKESLVYIRANDSIKIGNIT